MNKGVDDFLKGFEEAQKHKIEEHDEESLNEYFKTVQELLTDIMELDYPDSEEISGYDKNRLCKIFISQFNAESMLVNAMIMDIIKRANKNEGNLWAVLIDIFGIVTTCRADEAEKISSIFLS